MLRLRAEEQARLGDAFSLKGFHDALLYSGNLPISFHRRLLAGEGGGPTPPPATHPGRLMQIIPSLDLQNGRSRLVWWPGASTGSRHTDRPARRHRRSDGGAGRAGDPSRGPRWCGQGRPANLDAIGAIARAVARPLQLAGGVDGPEQIEIAFAAGATRVVMPLWAVAEDAALLADCLRIAGDWLAVGMDARPESLAGYPWQRRPRPSLADLVVELSAAGVRRFVFSHVSAEGMALVRQAGVRFRRGGAGGRWRDHARRVA